MSKWNNTRREQAESQRIHDLLKSDDFELV